MENTLHRSTNPDLQLDMMDLQTEVGKEASTYAYYGEQLVEAKAERDRLLNRLSLRESQIELDIRKEAESTGMKMTEGRIQALIKVNAEIVDLKDKIVDANKAVGTLSTTVDALEHKKAMVSNAVNMAVTNTCGLRLIQRDAATVSTEENTQTLAARLNRGNQNQ